MSKVYNGNEVTYSDNAERQIANFERSGLGHLPICMAKTQYSLTTDPSVKGVPEVQ